MLRYDTATGALDLTGKRYGNPDFSHGIGVYQTVVYHSVKTRHKIDLYNATTNAYTGELKVGLVAPEL
ncbi:hypothetical protein D3C80_2098940 [compost metagenome]